MCTKYAQVARHLDVITLLLQLKLERVVVVAQLFQLQLTTSACDVVTQQLQLRSQLLLVCSARAQLSLEIERLPADTHLRVTQLVLQVHVVRFRLACGFTQ